MLCERCHQAEAVVHIRGINAKGETQKLNLCAKCAFEEINHGALGSEEIADILKKITENPPEELAKFLQGSGFLSPSEDTACPRCKQKLSVVEKTHTIGCSECLTTFHKEIAGILDYDQLPQVHLAEQTALLGEDKTYKIRQKELELQSKLAAAVASEAYEEAEKLKNLLAIVRQERERQGGQDGTPDDCDDWGTRVFDAEGRIGEQLDNAIPQWLPQGQNYLPDIRISVRIALRRNLASHPLPQFLDSLAQEEVVKQEISQVMGLLPLTANMQAYSISRMPVVARGGLSRRGWCSYDFLQRGHNRYLMVSPNHRVIVRLCGGDHLELDCWGGPGELFQTAKAVSNFERYLGRPLNWLIGPDGYVCNHLEDCGYGIRGGVLMHLPALTMAGQLSKLDNACKTFGLHIRPFLPTDADGIEHFLVMLEPADCFKLDLQQQLSALEKVASILEQKELDCRLHLQGDNLARLKLIDSVAKAYALARSARLIQPDDGLNLLSMIWLGQELGMLPQVNRKQIFARMAELVFMPPVKKTQSAITASIKLAGLNADRMRATFN